MYVCIKNCIHRAWYYLYFQASTKGLGTYTLWIRGPTIIKIVLLWKKYLEVNEKALKILKQTHTYTVN